jgi:hypothetical protein
MVKATSGVAAGFGVKGLTSGRLMQKSHSSRRAILGGLRGSAATPADTRAALHYDNPKLWFPNPNPHLAGGSGLN